MSLKVEFDTDVIIEGKAYVLNNVENIEKADCYLIRRTFISADGKFRKVFEKIVPKPPAPVVALPPPPPAPAPGPAEATPEPEKAEEPWAEAPKAEEPKKGAFSKLFGKKKAKKP